MIVICVLARVLLSARGHRENMRESRSDLFGKTGLSDWFFLAAKKAIRELSHCFNEKTRGLKIRVSVVRFRPWAPHPFVINCFNWRF